MVRDVFEKLLVHEKVVASADNLRVHGVDVAGVRDPGVGEVEEAAPLLQGGAGSGLSLVDSWGVFKGRNVIQVP